MWLTYGASIVQLLSVIDKLIAYKYSYVIELFLCRKINVQSNLHRIWWKMFKQLPKIKFNITNLKVRVIHLCIMKFCYYDDLFHAQSFFK